MRRLVGAALLAASCLVPGLPEQGLARAAPTVLAQGAGGELTADAADAYGDAFEIALRETGRTTPLGETERATIREQLVSAFPSMRPEIQEDLAGMRAIVDRVRRTWDGLSSEERKGFALSVLTLAYGETDARRALGLTPPPELDGGLLIGGYGADPVATQQAEACALMPELCPSDDPLRLNGVPIQE